MSVSTQGVRYLGVGAVNTAFGYAVFVALQLSLGRIVPYMVVLVITQVIATLESYVTQRRFVFRAVGHFWRDLWRYSLVYSTTFLINLILLPILVSGAGWNVLAAQALIVAGLAIASFFAHRAFSFGRSSRGSH